jgi:DNA modification methylase
MIKEVSMDVRLADIKVGERFRKKFDGMDELAESILKHGLIEPIIVDEDLNLIAGERRFRAHEKLGLKTIEVKKMSDLSDLEKKEIELEENIQRKQFTWQEEVHAKNRLHQLKVEMHGKAVKGHEGLGWGLKDTANALGETKGTVSVDLQLAKGLRAFPELLKEKNKSTAYKKLKKMQERVLQEELNKRLKSYGLAEHPSIILGDCVAEMKKLEANSVDLILTDPPYGMDYEKCKTQDRDVAALQAGWEDGEEETFDLLDKVFAEAFRVLKQDRHMFVFCACDKSHILVDLMRKHGFEVNSVPIIWDKGSGSYPSQGVNFVASYEAFLHVRKGKRKLNGSPRNVFPIKRCSAKNKIHPTQKPTQLLRDLIGYTTTLGEMVLDPFAGSGSTIVAARETSRQAIGIEINPEYHQKIVKRLENLEESAED